MTYENEFPLKHHYDGDLYDRWQDHAKEVAAELQAIREEKLAELERIIAKAVLPWIGDGAVYSQGQAQMDREMSFRAGKAAVEALVKEGKV